MCACKCNISSTLKDLHKQHTISPHQRKLKQVSIHSLIKTASEHIKTICNKMEHYILLQELTGVVIGNKKSDSLEFAFFVVFFSNYHGWWKNLYITIIISSVIAAKVSAIQRRQRDIALVINELAVHHQMLKRIRTS